MDKELNQNEQRIIDYLDGVLSEAESKQFENDLDNDASLKSEFEKYQKLILGIKEYEREKIRNIISNSSDHKSEQPTTNKQNLKTFKMNDSTVQKRRNPWYSIAAAFFLVAAGAFWFLNQNTEPDYNKLFADNYKKEVESVDSHLKQLGTKLLASRGVTEKDTGTVLYNGERILALEAEQLEKQRVNNLMDGITKFKSADWKNATISLNTYCESYATAGEDYSKALFYLAKSKMNESRYTDAIDDYNKFLNQSTKDQEMQDIAEWDRAISYLQVDQNKVIEYLDEIAQNKRHKFQDDAKGLMDYLKA